MYLTENLVRKYEREIIERRRRVFTCLLEDEREEYIEKMEALDSMRFAAWLLRGRWFTNYAIMIDHIYDEYFRGAT